MADELEAKADAVAHESTRADPRTPRRSQPSQ
jgi:hypothetical protein